MHSSVSFLKWSGPFAANRYWGAHTTSNANESSTSFLSPGQSNQIAFVQGTKPATRERFDHQLSKIFFTLGGYDVIQRLTLSALPFSPAPLQAEHIGPPPGGKDEVYSETSATRVCDRFSFLRKLFI